MNCSVCQEELEIIEIVQGVQIEMEDECFDAQDPQEW